jgi:NTP pyrophosphatase (non-canonical NTP hydrolase)
MTHADTIREVETRMARAWNRYGAFASAHEALGVALEEWTELGMAVHANDLQAIGHEALDLAAVCIRLANACRDDDFAKRSIK